MYPCILTRLCSWSRWLGSAGWIISSPCVQQRSPTRWMSIFCLCYYHWTWDPQRNAHQMGRRWVLEMSASDHIQSTQTGVSLTVMKNIRYNNLPNWGFSHLLLTVFSLYKGTCTYLSGVLVCSRRTWPLSHTQTNSHLLGFLARVCTRSNSASPCKIRMKRGGMGGGFENKQPRGKWWRAEEMSEIRSCQPFFSTPTGNVLAHLIKCKVQLWKYTCSKSTLLSLSL